MARSCTWGAALLLSVGAAACAAGRVDSGTCVEGDCGAGRVCHEGRCVDLCNGDGECRPGDACQDGVCLPGERAAPPRCTPPEVSVAPLAPSDDIYAGFTVTTSATVNLVEARPACPLSQVWAVCGAPPGSVYAAEACTELATDAALSFTPDRHGTYELRFTAALPGQEVSRFLPLTVRADLLFAEVAVLDGAAAHEAQQRYRGLPCIGWDDATCAQSGCAWRTDALPEISVCWFDCSGATDLATCRQLSSTNGGHCAWSGDACGTADINLGAECLAGTLGDCASRTACRWADDVSACLPDCSRYSDLQLCIAAGCFATVDGVCQSSMYEIQMPVPVQVYSDGGGLTPVRTSALGFRYDPNGKFPEANLLGTGQTARLSGMDYASDTGTAVFPAAYLFERVDAASGLSYCRRQVTLLAWKQGALAGVPDLIEDLGTLKGDTSLEGSDAHIAYAPQLAVTPGSDDFTVVYGELEPTRYSFDSGETPCGAGDITYYGQTFAALTGGAPANDPLYGGIAARVILSRVEATRVARGTLRVRPGEFPCVHMYDCGGYGGNCDLDADNDGTPDGPGVCRISCSDDSYCGGVVGSCAVDNYCADCPPSGPCLGEYDLEAFLPRLQKGGSGIVFGLAVCNDGYGSRCPAASNLDLVAADIVEPTPRRFLLRHAQRLTQTPERELDPIWLGDFAGSGTLVYLSEASVAVHIVSATGTPVDAVVGGVDLVLQSAERQGDPWILGAAQLLYDGGRDDSAAPSALTVCGGEVYPSVAVRGAAEPVASPDERWLLFVEASRALGCSVEGSTPTLGSPTQTRLLLVDLAATPPTSTPIDLSACPGLADTVQSAPRFIAGGTQVVFSAHLPDEQYGSLWRLDLAAALAGGGACPAALLVDRAGVQAGLSAVRPDSEGLGITLATSATQFTVLDCRAAGATPWAAALVLLGLCRERRRRGRAHG